MPEILDVRERIDTLLVGLQNKDPRMHELIRLLADSHKSVVDVLQPVQAAVRDIQRKPAIPLVVTAFNYELHTTFVRFTWDYTDVNVVQAEIREGTVWDTAAFIVRSSTKRAEIDPITIGTHNYLIKTINASGIYSEPSVGLDVTIPAIGLPGALSAQVIDNNVLLRWTEPTSTFNIDYYEIWRAVPAGSLAFFSFNDTTFVTVFEMTAGVYQYGVIAVDIAGNKSAMATISASVNQPPDFILVSQYTSDFSGTKVNCVLSGGRLLVIVDTPDTWESHFLNEPLGPWDQPSDQVSAGFPIFIQPSVLSGSYQEVHDFGLLLSNVIVHSSWAEEEVSGTVTVTSTLEASSDGVNWSAPLPGPDSFFPSLRYTRLTLNFAATDPKNDLKWISNLRMSLDVKSVIDSGEVLALAEDGNGTLVTFNKAFKDVDSITTGVKSIPPLEVVIDFKDIPNPINFRLYVFDTAGTRVTQLVSWKARGVV